MSIFDEWHRRHLAHDPAPTPPFQAGQHVVIVTTDADSMFVNGLDGRVLDINPVTDPEDPYFPWQVGVLVHAFQTRMAFCSTELRHADNDDEDFAAARLPKRIPFTEDVSAAPIYDSVRAEHRSCTEFGNQVEADLKALTERNGR